MNAAHGARRTRRRLYDLPSPKLTRALHAGRSQLVEECSIDNWRSPLTCDVEELSDSIGVIVALGKFDAMHLGHQALAVKAAEMGGHPMLLSFSGMAEVLKWPARLPLVAPCDRARVLQLWARACKGRVPRQRMIPFHQIRGMQPEEFVQLLAHDLRAAGVVAGCNYRFGYRASGDAQALQTLGAKHGLQVTIMDLVPDSNLLEQQEQQQQQPLQDVNNSALQVSSSKIRSMLAHGDMSSVMRSLGRPYRFVLFLRDATRLFASLQQQQQQQQQQQNQGQGNTCAASEVTLTYPPGLGPEPIPASEHSSSTSTTTSSTSSTSSSRCEGSEQQVQQGDTASSSSNATSSTSGNGNTAAPNTRTLNQVPPQARVLNQPPGQGEYGCSVMLMPCPANSPEAQEEMAKFAGPEMGPGNLPPALASLYDDEDEGVQGPGSLQEHEHPFSLMRVRLQGDRLWLEAPPSASSDQLSKLRHQAEDTGTRPCYLAIDFDQSH